MDLDVPGTYTYEIDDNDGKSPATARDHDPVSSPDAIDQPVVTARTIKPSCIDQEPDEYDGAIILTISGEGTDKCSSQFTWSSTNVPGQSVASGSFDDGSATIPNLPSGDFTFVFQTLGPAGATGCLCTPLPPDPITVTIDVLQMCVIQGITLQIL